MADDNKLTAATGYEARHAARGNALVGIASQDANDAAGDYEGQGSSIAAAGHDFNAYDLSTFPVQFRSLVAPYIGNPQAVAQVMQHIDPYGLARLGGHSDPGHGVGFNMTPMGQPGQPAALAPEQFAPTSDPSAPAAQAPVHTLFQAPTPSFADQIAQHVQDEMERQRSGLSHAGDQGLSARYDINSGAQTLVQTIDAQRRARNAAEHHGQWQLENKAGDIEQAHGDAVRQAVETAGNDSAKRDIIWQGLKNARSVPMLHAYLDEYVKHLLGTADAKPARK